MKQSDISLGPMLLQNKKSVLFRGVPLGFVGCANEMTTVVILDQKSLVVWSKLLNYWAWTILWFGREHSPDLKKGSCLQGALFLCGVTWFAAMLRCTCWRKIHMKASFSHWIVHWISRMKSEFIHFMCFNVTNKNINARGYDALYSFEN